MGGKNEIQKREGSVVELESHVKLLYIGVMSRCLHTFYNIVFSAWCENHFRTINYRSDGISHVKYFKVLVKPQIGIQMRAFFLEL